jgi:hypothetical protein
MRIINNRHPKIVEKAAAKASSPVFESVTQRFLSSTKNNPVKCPLCDDIIDFNMGVKWHGPDTFTCGGCERLLSMHLIHRALKDLGIK